MRGKVVLIDFWSTTCGACVEAMPRIKAVHDRYRQQGFEVIGVALNEPGDRAEVERLLKKAGISWQQSLNGVGSPLQSRFGFQYVPVTFLLDRTGRLVTTDIDFAKGPRLEHEVRRLLAVDGGGDDGGV